MLYLLRPPSVPSGHLPHSDGGEIRRLMLASIKVLPYRNGEGFRMGANSLPIYASMRSVMCATLPRTFFLARRQ